MLGEALAALGLLWWHDWVVAQGTRFTEDLELNGEILRKVFRHEICFLVFQRHFKGASERMLMNALWSFG